MFEIDPVFLKHCFSFSIQSLSNIKWKEGYIFKKKEKIQGSKRELSKIDKKVFKATILTLPPFELQSNAYIILFSIEFVGSFIF